MLLPVSPGVAIGVLEPIEMVLERPVVFSDQGLGITGLQKLAGIRLVQGPRDHGTAFVDHCSIAQHQHRHGAFGRGLQHLRRLGLQSNFAPLDQQPRLQQGPTGAHRIGAAAEAVQDRQICRRQGYCHSAGGGRGLVDLTLAHGKALAVGGAETVHTVHALHPLDVGRQCPLLGGQG